MTKKLTIVGIIEVKDNQTEFVKENLFKLIEITKKEDGCLQYDLHQDNNNTNLFLLFENWQNKELWQKHMNNQPIKDFLKVTEGSVANITVHQMSLIR